jgi:hypothetical protein
VVDFRSTARIKETSISMKTQLLTLIFASLCLATAIRADEPKTTTATKEIPASAIEGVWERKGEGGFIGLKFISNGRWIITNRDAAGKVLFHHGGTYTYDGINYVESVEFANESSAEMIGSKFKFELSVKDDVLHQKGVDNPWTEDWTRVKK